MREISHTIKNNKQFFQVVVTSLCLQVVVFVGADLHNTAHLHAADTPNIVVILADDLGYGDVGCYNATSQIPTPHLDKMAQDGLLFTDAHSPSTVCTPTRYSLLTGHMSFRLNYKGVFTGVGGPCLITEDRLTLPGMLQEKGYTTAMYGKWHIGMSVPDKNGQPINKSGLDAVKLVDYSRPILDAPIHRGFNYFYGTVCCPTTDWLYAFVDGDRIPVPPTKIVDKANLPKHEWSFDCRPGLVAPNFNLEEVDMVFLNKSLNFLDNHHRTQPDKPFFLFHSMQAVHLPSFPGKDFQGKTKSGPHGDFIFECDYIVGKLLEKIKQLGYDDNTLVIISSDNGPEVGTVLAMRSLHQHNGANPWRGMKRDNWEGGHRVPMIVRWPGKVTAGTKTNQTVCLTDIMATCADIIGYSLPNNAAEDSFSLLSILRNTAKESIRPYTLHQTTSLALAIRQGKWKYLDHKGSGGNNYKKPELAVIDLPELAPDAPGQLYDIIADPGETKNLYNEHPEVVKAMKYLLEATKQSGRSAPMRGAKAP